MKKQIIHFAWLLISFDGMAQGSRQDLTQYYINSAKPCGGVDAIFSKKGNWKKNSDAIIFPDNSFPHNQYAQITARIDQIYPLFREALPDLSGFEPRWYRVIDGKSYIPNGAVPYEFSSLYLSYFCNSSTKQVEPGDETGTWVYVFVNQLNWFCDKVGDWDIHDDGKMITVYALPPKAGKWKETTLYAPTTHESARAVVLGHDEKLPWHSLTQKEYLVGLKNKWNGDSKKGMEAIDEGEEKIKKTISDLSKNTSPETPRIKQQMDQQLRDYQSQKEKNKASQRKFYDEEIKYIDDYMGSASAEALNQPAIIDPKYDALKFRGIFGDENNGGERLIAIGSLYFKANLPRYAPQFMVLYWRWTNDPPSLRFRQEFEENFPLGKLKAMIDK